MRKNKIVGNLIMLIALLIPIYIFGSMIVVKLNEKGDYLQYSNRISNLDESYFQMRKEQEKEYNSKLDANKRDIIDPFGVEDYKSLYNINLKGENYGYINIPSLNFKKPINLGATEYNISRGLGHIDGTSLPDSGLNSRTVFAVHRIGRTDRLLYNADEIKAGDIAIIDLGNKVIIYLYDNTKIIEPSQWEELLPIPNEEIFTILTCDPPYPPFSNRMLINFKKIAQYNLTKDINSNYNGSKTESIISSRDLMTNIFNNPSEFQQKEKIDFLNGKNLEPELKIMDMLIYILTALLTIVFLVILIRFIKLLKQKTGDIYEKNK